MGQALSSEFARPEAVGDRPASPCGPAGSPGLSAQGLDFALFDEFAAPELLDLPVQVADFRHGPPPGAGQSWGRRPLRTAQGSPGKSEGEPANQRVRTGGGGDSILGPPPLPSRRSRTLGVPLPWPHPANSRRTPRARAKDGGLEGPRTITAARTPAGSLRLPTFLRFGPPPPPRLLPASPRKQREARAVAHRK